MICHPKGSSLKIRSGHGTLRTGVDPQGSSLFQSGTLLEPYRYTVCVLVLLFHQTLNRHAGFMPASCLRHVGVMPASCRLHACVMPASCLRHAGVMPASSCRRSSPCEYLTCHYSVRPDLITSQCLLLEPPLIHTALINRYHAVVLYVNVRIAAEHKDHTSLVILCSLAGVGCYRMPTLCAVSGSAIAFGQKCIACRSWVIQYSRVKDSIHRLNL